MAAKHGSKYDGSWLNPIAGAPVHAENIYGAFSIQTFYNSPPLSYTHADAQGWLDYLGLYYQNNFWFKDADVRALWYYEPGDHYLGYYGIDAVLAAYHAGHGGMNSAGVFYAPMGDVWETESSAHSDRMSLGDQVANYVFWSTCYSLVTVGGQTPVHTWSAADKGFRMLFGYNSTSVDDPNYGKFFWEEWEKGKSLTHAFLDASWRISQYQSPAVTAVGGTAQEAGDRFENERYLYWEHVPTSNWTWGWYTATAAAELTALEMIQGGLIGDLYPLQSAEERAADILTAFGFAQSGPSLKGASGQLIALDDAYRLAVEPNGGYELYLPAQTQDRPAKILGKEEAFTMARKFISLNHLENQGGLKLIRQRQLHRAGSAVDGVPQEQPTETTFIYAQQIEGIPVVSTDAGQLSITVGGGGAVKSVRDTRRGVKELHKRYRQTVTPPGAEKPASDPIKILEDAYRAEAKRRWQDRGYELPQLRPVAGSTAVGYHLEGNEAYLAACCEVEAEFASGLTTRFKVMVPLYR